VILGQIQLCKVTQESPVIPEHKETQVLTPLCQVIRGHKETLESKEIPEQIRLYKAIQEWLETQELTQQFQETLV